MVMSVNTQPKSCPETPLEAAIAPSLSCLAADSASRGVFGYDGGGAMVLDKRGFPDFFTVNDVTGDGPCLVGRTGCIYTGKRVQQIMADIESFYDKYSDAEIERINEQWLAQERARRTRGRQSNATSRRKNERRRKLYEEMNGRCAYCGHRLEKNWHIEHKVPKSRYNSYRDAPPNNRVASCPECNMHKGTKTVDEFREWLKSNLVERGLWPENEPYLFYMEVKDTKEGEKREVINDLIDEGAIAPSASIISDMMQEIEED